MTFNYDKVGVQCTTFVFKETAKHFGFPFERLWSPQESMEELKKQTVASWSNHDDTIKA